MYRAGYDALDIIALNQIRQIERYVDSYRISTLHLVIKDYAKRIRTPFEQAVMQCDKAKQGKDIEPEDTQQHPTFFALYKEAIAIFDAILTVLHENDTDLVALEEESCRVYHKQRNWAIAGIVVTVVVAIAAIIVTLCLTL